MRNTTTKPARRQRLSTFLAQRSAKQLSSLSFVRKHKGTLSISRIETGSYRAVFRSETTGRKAHAYGITFQGAYQNMIRLYNVKYFAS